MTNNRKPEIRLSLSAAKVRASRTCDCEQPEPNEEGVVVWSDECPIHAPLMDKPENEIVGRCSARVGWTPAPSPALYSRHEADKPKGRDYDAILRAAKKKPVGYYEDAPRGIKFGGQPLPSAGHGKDVDTADGPWPKCAYASAETNRWHSGEIVAVYEDADDGGTCYFDNGHVQCCSQSYERNISAGGFVPIALANAIPKLEQNGHKDVAAQLRGKDEFEPVGTMPVVGDTLVFADGRGGGNPITFVDVSATLFADRAWARQCQNNGELWTSDSTHAKRDWYARNGRILKRPTPPRDDVATGGGWRAGVEMH